MKCQIEMVQQISINRPREVSKATIQFVPNLGHGIVNLSCNVLGINYCFGVSIVTLINKLCKMINVECRKIESWPSLSSFSENKANPDMAVKLVGFRGVIQ